MALVAGEKNDRIDFMSPKPEPFLSPDAVLCFRAVRIGGMVVFWDRGGQSVELVDTLLGSLMRRAEKMVGKGAKLVRVS